MGCTHCCAPQLVLRPALARVQGQQCAWAKLSAIQANCDVEVTMDECLKQVRALSSVLLSSVLQPGLVVEGRQNIEWEVWVQVCFRLARSALEYMSVCSHCSPGQAVARCLHATPGFVAAHGCCCPNLLPQVTAVAARERWRMARSAKAVGMRRGIPSWVHMPSVGGSASAVGGVVRWAACSPNAVC